VEIWADNVSLQPFTKKQWRSLQDASIERVSLYANPTLLTNVEIYMKANAFLFSNI